MTSALLMCKYYTLIANVQDNWSGSGLSPLPGPRRAVARHWYPDVSSSDGHARHTRGCQTVASGGHERALSRGHRGLSPRGDPRPADGAPGHHGTGPRARRLQDRELDTGYDTRRRVPEGVFARVSQTAVCDTCGSATAVRSGRLGVPQLPRSLSRRPIPCAPHRMITSSTTP